MKSDQYLKLVKKHSADENKWKHYITAFVVGGVIGMFGNFLIDFYSIVFSISSSDAGVFMIVTLIFIASLSTALGFFDEFVKWGRMGVIVPITGFAHSMTSATMDYKKEGLVNGMGSNMFRLAGTVIVYGVVSTYFFGIIRIILGG